MFLREDLLIKISGEKYMTKDLQTVGQTVKSTNKLQIAVKESNRFENFFF
jgi:hypothetical protein